MNRAEKQTEIEFLSDCFRRTKVTMLVDYLGVDVAKMTTIRKELRESGAVSQVVKNTLARRSVESVMGGDAPASFSKFIDLLEGPNLMIFSFEDPVSPAKVVTKFAKANEKFKVKGGWFDGAFVDPSGVDALSKLPSREETLAKLLSLLNTPATQLLRLMKAPASQVVQVIEAHRQNLEKKG